MTSKEIGKSVVTSVTMGLLIVSVASLMATGFAIYVVKNAVQDGMNKLRKKEDETSG